MRQTTITAFVIGLCLLLTGCFQHTVTLGTGAPDGKMVYKAWHHHWVLGLVRPAYQENVLASELCPSGNATIHEETSFLNGLIDVLIGFIYSPTTLTITCDDGSKATVELSTEEVALIIHDPLFLDIVDERFPDRLSDARKARIELPAADSLFVMKPTR